MSKKIIMPLVVLGLLALSLEAMADKACSAAKKGATCSKAKKVCPVATALKAAKVTPAQQKKIDALMVQLKATCTKAKACRCPVKSAKDVKKAKQAFCCKMLAVLTAEQRKTVQPVVAKWAGCTKHAKACDAKVCDAKACDAKACDAKASDAKAKKSCCGTCGG